MTEPNLKDHYGNDLHVGDYIVFPTSNDGNAFTGYLSKPNVYVVASEKDLGHTGPAGYVAARLGGTAWYQWLLAENVMKLPTDKTEREEKLFLLKLEGFLS